MFSSSSLNDDQKAKIASWVAGGEDLSGIQKLMESELEISITYMDTRFLILDLGLEIKDREQAPDPVVKAQAELVTDGEVPAGGGVRVSLDDEPVAGMLVSGMVTFSDGERGIFYIDQMGRPSLDSDTPGYQPREDDIIDFQRQLQSLMAEEA